MREAELEELLSRLCENGNAEKGVCTQREPISDAEMIAILKDIRYKQGKGTILFGVDGDGTVCGLTSAQALQLKRQAFHLGSRLKPHILPEAVCIEFGCKLVVGLFVDELTAKDMPCFIP